MDTALQLKLRIIDFYAPFSYLLQYQSEYDHIQANLYYPNATVFCPFHENRVTKSAKVYQKDLSDSYPSEKLYCFSENRVFFPHSLLSPPYPSMGKPLFYSIVPYTPDKVFSAIWDHLPDEDKSYWNTVNPNMLVGDQKKLLSPAFQLYKESKTTLFSLLSEVYLPKE